MLSATLVNLDTGESMGDVAISMIGLPTPSVMTADDVKIGFRTDSFSGGTGDTTIDIRYPDGTTAKVHIDPCLPGN